MTSGTVKWYNRGKRFGFITTDEGIDIYVHGTSVPSAVLRAGDAVEFTVEETERGPQAESVVVVRAAENPAAGATVELVDQVESVVRRLDSMLHSLRAGRSVGSEAAFYAAREMRRLASRLNPPVA